jgi:hypothetical protein
MLSTQSAGLLARTVINIMVFRVHLEVSLSYRKNTHPICLNPPFRRSSNDDDIKKSPSDTMVDGN